LCHLWVDAGYRGRFVDWAETTPTRSVEVVQHWWTGVRAVWVAEGAEPATMPVWFHVLPRRWVVERTFAWPGRYRRLSKDDEAPPGTEDAWIPLIMVRLMFARMAR
jgi:transposase